MAERVLDKNEISINGEHYRLANDVQFFLASQQPGKVSFGEFTDETNPRASSWEIRDITGGIGLEESDFNDPSHLRRIWYGDVQIPFLGQIVLPRLTTATARAEVSDAQVLADFLDVVYVCHGTTVYSYDNTIDTWTSVRTLLANATDWAQGLVGGTDTLVIATGSEVDYTTDGTTWNRNTTDIKFVVTWKDLLWGIDQSGQLYYTDDLSSPWTTDAQLPLEDDQITKLVVARSADRIQTLYAATKQGLFIHDETYERFLKTDFMLPAHPDGGRGTRVWRGRIYFPAGNSIYEFQADPSVTQVSTMGPDRDHGLPSQKRGSIVALEGSHNSLLAALDAASATGVSTLETRSSGGMGSSRKGAFGANIGFSIILGWNTRGWEVRWESGSSDRAINAMLVSNAYSTYRLWWAANERVYYQALPLDVINPLKVKTTDYAADAQFETPWFTGGAPSQTKLALSVLVETNNPTSSETVKVEYATDWSESYTTITTATSSGESENFLGTNRAGVAFRAWKFRVTLARGSTTTNTPTLRRIVLNFRKRIRVLYGIQAFLDVSKPWKDVPPPQQLANLRTAVNNATLVEITWKDNTTDSENYFMDIEDIRSVESTGHGTQAQVLVRAAEPEQSTSR